MEQPDLYHVLLVDPDADQDVIRAAYRALAARHHPDVGGTAEQMAALNRAYAVLSDPVVRATYDRRRRAVLANDRARAASPDDGPAAVAAPSPGPGSGDGRSSVLDYGRYTGWTIEQVARHDPDFLEWFVRTPGGRPYHAEVARELRQVQAATAVAPDPGSRGRSRRW